MKLELVLQLCDCHGAAWVLVL